MGSEEKKIGSNYVVLKHTGHIPRIYKNFILSKWMRSYRYGNDYIRLADSDSYFIAYTLYIEMILSNPITTIRIATLDDDQENALGFSVCRGTILDYVHVHKDFRKNGIGKRLIPPGIETFTHLTKTGMKLWPTKMPNAKFNPFA